ncbi:MAG: hypothetical protein AAFU81_11800 [Pseudomonadota bacterium]
MSEDKKRPLETMRDGNIKAAIWENEHDGKRLHNVQFTRLYRDQEGNTRDAHTFSGADLLKVSRLAERGYDRVQELREEMREIAKGREEKPRTRKRTRDRDEGYER